VPARRTSSPGRSRFTELVDGLAARVGKSEPVLPAVEEVTGRPAFTYAQWVAHRAADFGSTPA
jgi:hypothetical protein